MDGLRCAMTIFYNMLVDESLWLETWFEKCIFLDQNQPFLVGCECHGWLALL